MKALSPRRILALLGLFALAAIGFVALRHRAHDEESAPRPLGFAFAWPKGATYTYALAWRGESHVRLPGVAGAGPRGMSTGDGVSLDGRVDLAADLSLRSYGAMGDAVVLGARLERPTHHDLVMLGHSVLPTADAARDAFAGQEAFLAVDATGLVRAVHFAKDANPIFRTVMQSVAELGEVVVPAGAGARWTTTEATPVGRGEVDYFVEERDPPRLVRTRHPYAALFGLPSTPAQGAIDERADAEIVLTPTGQIASLDEKEKLAVHDGAPGAPDRLASTTTFSMTLTSVGTGDATSAPDLASLDRVTPGELTTSDRARAQMLDQRVAGMTFDDLRQDVFSLALTGSTGDDRWLLRASGLLEQQPTLCMDLAAVFEDARLNTKGRAQILDLLAGAGSPQAQEAMRVALSSDVAHADARVFDALLQRFSLVSHPTPESLAFIADAQRDAKTSDARAAATYALGAVAGNAMRAGDTSAAPTYGAALVDALGHARTPSDRRAAVAGLGNLGWEGAVPKLHALAHDEDPRIRGAAAWALRKTDTPEAREALVDLASDAAPEVEARAFEAMETLPSIDPDELTSLSHAVTSGATSASADPALLPLLTAHPEGGAPVASMLRVLLARNDADHQMAAEIRHALAAMQ